MDNIVKQAVTDFASSANEFLQTIETVSDHDFNRVPFKGSWTPGQIAEHIRLSVSGTTALLNAPAQSTERPPNKFVKALKDMFLDFKAKYTSAQVITPADKQYDKASLNHELKAVFDALIQGIESKDLTETSLAAEIPGMGHLTRLEWVTLAIYHTQRHSHQVREVMAYF